MGASKNHGAQTWIPNSRPLLIRTPTRRTPNLWKQPKCVNPDPGWSHPVVRHSCWYLVSPCSSGVLFGVYEVQCIKSKGLRSPIHTPTGTCQRNFSFEGEVIEHSIRSSRSADPRTGGLMDFVKQCIRQQLSRK